MNRLFVYGTLKFGKVNHYLLGGQTFIQNTEWQGFDLYNFNNEFPVAIKGHGVIKGEIYEIDNKTLDILDEFEGVHDGLFIRELYQGSFIYLAGGSFNITSLSLISSGVW